MKKILIIITFIMLSGSCYVDIISPEVIAVSPDHGISVNPDTVITMSFSEVMNTESVEKSFTLSSDNGISNGVFSWSSDNMSFTYTPQLPLKNGMSYSISLDRAASDIPGNALKARHLSTFTIGVDLTPPEIESTTPLNNSATFPLNNTIEVVFSESMDKMSVERNLKINPSVEGTFSWTGSTTVVFTPSKPLEFNTDYSLIIPVDCKDVAGNQMLKRTEIFFTAGEEFTKPFVEEISTPNKSWLDFPDFSMIDEIDRTDSIRFVFSEAVNRQSFIDSLKIFPEVERFYIWENDSTCEVNFVNDLTPLAEYELRLLPGTKDLTGNEMEGTKIYTFKVNHPSCLPPEIESIEIFNTDTDEPYEVDILANQHIENVIDASISESAKIKIKITFSKAIDATSFFNSVNINYEYGPFTEATGTKKDFDQNEDSTIFTMFFTSMNNFNCYSFTISGEDGGLQSKDGIFMENSFKSYFYFNGEAND